jgi:cell division protein FtsW (lipid II flippase)
MLKPNGETTKTSYFEEPSQDFCTVICLEEVPIIWVIIVTLLNFCLSVRTKVSFSRVELARNN